MLEQVLTHIQNWFRVRDAVCGIHHGEFTIEGGFIALPFLRDGQYFRIMNSVFNDGLYQYKAPVEPLDEEGEDPDPPEEPPEPDPVPDEPAGYLTDETFDGTIWALAVPAAVVKLAAEMAEWEEKHGPKSIGIYQSESYAGYSYSKYTNGHGSPINVWDVFSERLDPYRKLREI